MSAAGEQLEVDIVAIGSGGDGVAETPGGRLYVPCTLPGDRVRLTTDGRTVGNVVRIRDGSGRIVPVCGHFGVCGGCALQHVGDDDYRRWKSDLPGQALSRRGLIAEIAPMVRIDPGSRRRARFGARATKAGVIVGFKERRSHRLVDIAACAVLLPAIAALLPALRAVLRDCLAAGESADVAVTLAEGGLDVGIEARGTPDLAMRERLTRFAEDADLARLSWSDETVIRRRAVRLSLAGIAVDLPPAAFVQPTAAGEAALCDAVTTGLAGVNRVADLYAGCGAFTFALAAAGAAVRAVELDPAQTAAIDAAARRSGLAQRVAAEARDLNRRPLAGRELARLDGLVLDPPRAGALRQATAIAEDPVPTVVYASCNPTSFARDARILVDGGYRLERVVPVDQFPWSPHLELVALLRRT